MKTGITQKRFLFYIWLALAWLFVHMLVNLSNDDDTFWVRTVNDLWRTVYVTILNYFLFEYTLPFIKFRFKRILAGLFLIWLHLMLYSFGLYAWRLMGMAFHIYTPIPTVAPIESVLETQMGFSVGSVFLFGIIRHIYGYIKLKQTTQQLRIEKQQAELNYLKSQTNPHFLFNTLNNIYSLSRDKSDLAPESICLLYTSPSPRD